MAAINPGFYWGLFFLAEYGAVPVRMVATTHFRTKQKAESPSEQVIQRLKDCGLTLHPEKTKLVQVTLLRKWYKNYSSRMITHHEV